jgi:photosystem II stability/assembly factor-like uncharacterized protein
MARLRMLTILLTISALFPSTTRAADPKPSADPAPWVDVSKPTLDKLKAEGKKFGYAGETAGVAVDAASGDVYMIVNGLGVWKSTDAGATFAQVDGGKVGGRCETGYSLNIDPAGKRLACFMLDGKCAWTADAGQTWTAMTDVGRNWDYAAVDWSAEGADVKTIFAAHHEDGGQTNLSTDGGKTWTKVFREMEFDRNGGLGVMDAKTLVYSHKGKGIMRSTDLGQTWAKVSDVDAIGRVAKVHKGTAYWLAKDGMLVSKDQGATWTKQGTAVDATIGPMIDPKDERHFAAAGNKGIFETTDGGQTWKQVIAKLPPTMSTPKAGWYANVAWDPARGIFYASQMGKPLYKLPK